MLLFVDIVFFDEPRLHLGELGEIGVFVEDDGVHAEEDRASVHAIFQRGDVAPDHRVFLFFDADVERIAHRLPALAAADEDFAMVLPFIVEHIVQNLRFERAEVLVVRPVSDLLDEIFAIEQDVHDGKRELEAVVLFVVGECSWAKRQLVHADTSSCNGKSVLDDGILADFSARKVNTVLTFSFLSHERSS